jgi:hypothetical protein
MWVRRYLLEGRRRPSGWPRPVDGREVERVRDQLRVLHSRRSLSASYAREAFRVAAPPTTANAGADGGARLGVDPAAARPESPAPAMVAYALRWLELGDGRRRPPITHLLAEAG